MKRCIMIFVGFTKLYAWILNFLITIFLTDYIPAYQLGILIGRLDESDELGPFPLDMSGI